MMYRRPRHLLFHRDRRGGGDVPRPQAAAEIQFAEHKCVSGLPKVQHTGRNLDTLSLTVQLFPLTPLALTVDMRIDALRELAVLGEEVPLVLGLTYYGLYVLKSVEVQHRIFHNGVTMSAEIALNLTEYN